MENDLKKVKSVKKKKKGDIKPKEKKTELHFESPLATRRKKSGDKGPSSEACLKKWQPKPYGTCGKLQKNHKCAQMENSKR